MARLRTGKDLKYDTTMGTVYALRARHARATATASSNHNQLKATEAHASDSLKRVRYVKNEVWINVEVFYEGLNNAICNDFWPFFTRLGFELIELAKDTGAMKYDRLWQRRRRSVLPKAGEGGMRRCIMVQPAQHLMPIGCVATAGTSGCLRTRPGSSQSWGTCNLLARDSGFCASLFFVFPAGKSNRFLAFSRASPMR